jgi:hypothetical protein
VKEFIVWTSTIWPILLSLIGAAGILSGWIIRHDFGKKQEDMPKLHKFHQKWAGILGIAIVILLVLAGIVVTILINRHPVAALTTQQTNLTVEDYDPLRQFNLAIPSSEHLDKDMDIRVSRTNRFDLDQYNMEIMLINAMIINHSTSVKDFTAYVVWEDRPRNKQDGTQIKFIAFEPTDQLVTAIRTKAESGSLQSIGDYLKFPVSVDPQKSIQGFMLFVTDKSVFDKANPNGLPSADSTDTRIYLEWTNLLNEENYWMILWPGPLPSTVEK